MLLSYIYWTWIVAKPFFSLLYLGGKQRVEGSSCDSEICNKKLNMGQNPSTALGSRPHVDLTHLVNDHFIIIIFL